MTPTVTFVVPCYKLAHLLPECVTSILSQTYTDFELLVMDDCSPDDTPHVAQSFSDPRVTYVRNETNLGHLRNYNKGIGMARGKYVWLISADDRLRSPYILEKYVRAMDSNPAVGFACCAGMELRRNGEERILAYSAQASRDRIFNGRVFLKRLLHQNTVLACSGMVRKTCYDKLGVFPLDMPYAGDWYLWCLIALHYDVAFFAEPMVSYRTHDLSMTNVLANSRPAVFVEDDLKVLWRLKRDASLAGESSIEKRCLRHLGLIYARATVPGSCQTAPNGSPSAMSLEEVEHSIRQFAANQTEVNATKAWVYSYIGDHHYSLRRLDMARGCYQRALAIDLWMSKVWVKRVLLSTGPVGDFIRDGAFALRRSVAR
jgi:glycosyltransferase involved in cell wall biosynthesis